MKPGNDEDADNTGGRKDDDECDSDGIVQIYCTSLPPRVLISSRDVRVRLYRLVYSVILWLDARFQ